MKFTMKDEGYDVTTAFGTIPVNGNEETGFKPGELLVASIVVCSASVLRKVLEKMRMPADEVLVDVRSVERDEENGNRFSSIHFHLTIIGDAVKEERLEKAVEVATKNCAMIQTVKDVIDIQKTYEWQPSKKD